MLKPSPSHKLIDERHSIIANKFKALLSLRLALRLARQLSRVVNQLLFRPGARKLHLPITTCAYFLLSTTISHICSAAGQDIEISSIDRHLYGKSPFSIWSPLNDFELNTIAGFPNQHDRNPEKLLALYLIASGEIRTQSEFNTINTRLDQWIESNTQNFKGSRSQFEIGKNLLAAMHDSFFIPSSEENPLGSYDLDQSQLTNILETKNYNCISSSLLYIVLAHKLGLKAEAVLVPSHVFVQLNLENGPIEIETTSANGFDVVHDEEYYAQNSAQWFSDRQLREVNYDDYLNRKILSPARIGTENMWSQHTKAERMNYRDRMRLAEIKSYLEPDNYLAQKNRLSYYSSEFNALLNQQDTDTLAYLFNHIEAYINNIPKFSSSDAAKADLEFQNLLAWTYSNQAYSFVNSIDPDKGLMLAQDFLSKLPKNILDKEKIKTNLYLSIGIYADKKAQEKDFAKGKAAFEGIEQQCADHHACEVGLRKFYSAWGKHYWELKNWKESINIYTRFLSLNNSGDHVDDFRTNAESAYLNLANEFLLDEDWDAAIENLENCLAQLRDPERCEKNLEKIQNAISQMEE
ncbi:transglutaminase family protein [Aurantivibrio infirmus]